MLREYDGVLRRAPRGVRFTDVPDAGLCDTCAHQQLVHTTRDSTFTLCELSKSDPDYPKYPRIPVRECEGWRERDDAAGEER